jgi:hypothetical protein
MDTPLVISSCLTYLITHYEVEGSIALTFHGMLNDRHLKLCQTI